MENRDLRKTWNGREEPEAALKAEEPAEAGAGGNTALTAAGNTETGFITIGNRPGGLRKRAGELGNRANGKPVLNRPVPEEAANCYPDTRNWTEEQQNAYLTDNWPLIHVTVRRYTAFQSRFSDCALDLEDLCQVAATACWSAMATYDPGRGVKFSTYACRCMQNALYDVLYSQKANSLLQSAVSCDSNGLDDGGLLSGAGRADNMDFSDPSQSPEENVSCRELCRFIEKAIRDHGNPKVQGILNDIVQGYRQEDIARRNHCAQTTVSYYKMHLKKQLKEAGFLHD